MKATVTLLSNVSTTKSHANFFANEKSIQLNWCTSALAKNYTCVEVGKEKFQISSSWCSCDDERVLQKAVTNEDSIPFLRGTCGIMLEHCGQGLWR